VSRLIKYAYETSPAAGKFPTVALNTTCCCKYTVKSLSAESFSTEESPAYVNAGPDANKPSGKACSVVGGKTID